ncbi:hypothetical protein Lumi_102 [Xylophilus phage Lumi]|nr:hypothetical protein Lumi_102 [Xylophilus phage Lumi]
MKALTTTQQLDNCIMALFLWRTTVKPEQVVPGLRCFGISGTCGTLACFGGWLSTWKHFQKQGVRVLNEAGNRLAKATFPGAPYMLDPERELGLIGHPSEVARHLFGRDDMFARNLGLMDDYSEVICRLEGQISALNAQKYEEEQSVRSYPHLG